MKALFVTNSIFGASVIGDRFEIDVVYKDKIIKGQRLDILVENEVIVEIKSLGKLADVSMAQVLSNLKAAGLKRALIINFGAKMLREGIKRISP